MRRLDPPALDRACEMRRNGSTHLDDKTLQGR
jgi:hypothetical protein